MSDNRSSRHVGRLLAEFFIIVIGVLVALAADRWLMALDDRELEQVYLASLIQDVRDDSALVSGRAVSAAQGLDVALELLSAFENPSHVVTDTAAFIVGFETVAWSILPDFSTNTWSDLISTGNLRVIRNEGVRRAIGRLYESVDFYLTLAEDWEEQLAEYDDRIRAVNPPSRRLEITRGFRGEYVPEVTAADLARVRSAGATDPEIRARLGQVAIILRSKAANLRYLGEELGETLELLSDYSRRMSTQ